jgi:hypothetical protein
MNVAAPVRKFAFVLLALVAGLSAAKAQDDESFMPKGGKTLFLEATGKSAASELREIGNTSHSETEWRDYWSARHKPASERELAEITAYLVVNFPLPEGAVQQAGSDIASALPDDGRELAWKECQFCHSLYSGYLMQQRDVQGWRSIFLSPFHKNLKMTAQQRETFARYSAINMPMKSSDVPAALRY